MFNDWEPPRTATDASGMRSLSLPRDVVAGRLRYLDSGKIVNDRGFNNWVPSTAEGIVTLIIDKQKENVGPYIRFLTE
jgi:hypothetical protein